ncbi:hypothetical protein CEXT_331811 [Caerostris extrusa]|uniref:Uncharacterized protein n=1 Tax=Caerostris extrusa TaxID=172846 RepID=A0AAV4TCU7_CAEEX|nr:hypothetical protein CEXT_331811 [Caerostris extrusa]
MQEILHLFVAPLFHTYASEFSNNQILDCPSPCLESDTSIRHISRRDLSVSRHSSSERGMKFLFLFFSTGPGYHECEWIRALFCELMNGQHEREGGIFYSTARLYHECKGIRAVFCEWINEQHERGGTFYSSRFFANEDSYNPTADVWHVNPQCSMFLHNPINVRPMLFNVLHNPIRFVSIVQCYCTILSDAYPMFNVLHNPINVHPMSNVIVQSNPMRIHCPMLLHNPIRCVSNVQCFCTTINQCASNVQCYCTIHSDAYTLSNVVAQSYPMRIQCSMLLHNEVRCVSINVQCYCTIQSDACPMLLHNPILHEILNFCGTTVFIPMYLNFQSIYLFESDTSIRYISHRTYRFPGN